ncbi:MAG: hypothetical protein ACLFM1_10455 [Bacteroidales bacterium]
MNELEGNNAYEKLQQLLKEKRDNFRVMEKQVDIDVQMKYFDAAKDIKENLPDAETVLSEAREKLNDPDTDTEEKKRLLSQLASLEDVKAFRMIEAWLENPDEELADWAYLAYQESLMLMESAFSDEEKVFISSGMGGKENKLRYFVVFLHGELDSAFSESQKNLIKKELSYQFEKEDAELEENEFQKAYFMFSCLIPIKTNITTMFKKVISEINQFGNILSDNFLVTNVKKLSVEEIDQFIDSEMQKALDGLDKNDITNDFDNDVNPLDDDDDDE